MTITWAVLLCMLALVMPPFRNIITDMCQKEAQTRLGQVPVVVLRQAARRVPREWRADFFAEWLAELEEIRRATSETPVTSLVRQVLFTLSLLVHARAVAREFTGEPLPWIPRSLLRGTILRRVLDGIRQRVVRSLKPGLPTAPRVSGSGAVSLRWPIALVGAVALAAASTFFVVNLTLNGAEPPSGSRTPPAAGTLNPNPLSFSIPVAPSELLANDSRPAAALLLADVKYELEMHAPGFSAGFVMVFASGTAGNTTQAVTAANEVVSLLKTRDPQEFRNAAGEGFWTSDQAIYWTSGRGGFTVRVYLFEKPGPDW
jgi:hypothetical protein